MYVLVLSPIVRPEKVMYTFPQLTCSFGFGLSHHTLHSLSVDHAVDDSMRYVDIFAPNSLASDYPNEHNHELDCTVVRMKYEITWLRARSANFEGAMVPNPADPDAHGRSGEDERLLAIGAGSDRKHLAKVECTRLFLVANRFHLHERSQ